MFTQGFKKTAGITVGGVAQGVGRFLSPSRGIGALGARIGQAFKGVGSVIDSAGAKRLQGYREAATGMAKKMPGTSLAEKRLQKAQGLGQKAGLTEMEQQAKRIQRQSGSDVMNRFNRVKARQPSWAARHPLLMLGAGAAGMKALSGSGGQSDQSPQVNASQYGY